MKLIHWGPARRRTAWRGIQLDLTLDEVMQDLVGVPSVRLGRLRGRG